MLIKKRIGLTESFKYISFFEDDNYQYLNRRYPKLITNFEKCEIYF